MRPESIPRVEEVALIVVWPFLIEVPRGGLERVLVLGWNSDGITMA